MQPPYLESGMRLEFGSRRGGHTFAPGLALCFFVCVTLLGCDAERRKSDAELGLSPQQAAGRQVYDNYCDRCHEAYSKKGKKGPSLQSVFKKPYFALNGLPANDERASDIIRHGRNQMPAYGQVFSDQQVADLLAYLHTL
jgi:mono/diheme cytochrome c family protein